MAIHTAIDRQWRDFQTFAPQGGQGQGSQQGSGGPSVFDTVRNRVREITGGGDIQFDESEALVGQQPEAVRTAMRADLSWAQSVVQRYRTNPAAMPPDVRLRLGQIAQQINRLRRGPASPATQVQDAIPHHATVGDMYRR